MKLYENDRYNITGRKFIIIIFFLHNCYISMNWNSVLSLFEINPPSIEEYLHLDENDPLHEDEDGEVPLRCTFDYWYKEVIYYPTWNIVVDLWELTFKEGYKNKEFYEIPT